MLLDLDEGTLTVYKDGKRLSIVMSGLSGESGILLVSLSFDSRSETSSDNWLSSVIG